MELQKVGHPQGFSSPADESGDMLEDVAFQSSPLAGYCESSPRELPPKG